MRLRRPPNAGAPGGAVLVALAEKGVWNHISRFVHLEGPLRCRRAAALSRTDTRHSMAATWPSKLSGRICRRFGEVRLPRECVGNDSLRGRDIIFTVTRNLWREKAGWSAPA